MKKILLMIVSITLLYGCDFYPDNGTGIDGVVRMDGKKWKTKEHSGETEVEKRYYKTGKVMTITERRNGKVHGVSKVFSPDGELTQEIHYKYGKKHGTCKSWAAGFMYINETWKNGVKIK